MSQCLTKSFYIGHYVFKVGHKVFVFVVKMLYSTTKIQLKIEAITTQEHKKHENNQWRLPIKIHMDWNLGSLVQGCLTHSLG